jgi:NAD(P)-dependent dehydrogenase (short-subunit alcohol dehydrogenase family)
MHDFKPNDPRSPLYFPCPVSTFRKQPYAAIDPNLPALSAQGKVVFITGGGTGIGHSIARAFATAHAKVIIITGRRAHVVENAASKLAAEFPDTQFKGYGVGTTDRDGITKLVTSVRSEFGEINILVLNAGYGPPLSKTTDISWANTEQAYGTNVFGNLNLVHAYLAPVDTKYAGAGTQKTIIDVSTCATHVTTLTNMSVYAASKASWAILLDRLSGEYPPEELRVHSFHPGSVLTELAADAGFTEDAIDWDDINLPGHYAVWLASPEGEFLRNRLVWCHWDVNEMKAMKDKLDANKDLFTLRLMSV